MPSVVIGVDALRHSGSADMDGHCTAPGCENALAGNPHTQRTCSDACRARLYRARKLKRQFGDLARWGHCYACGRVIFRKRKDRSYCSAHCRKAMSTGRHKVRPLSESERMDADALRKRKVLEIVEGRDAERPQ